MLQSGSVRCPCPGIFLEVCVHQRVHHEWNGTTMLDSRVMHFRDGELQVGRWFAKQVDSYDGVAWDI